MSCRAAFPLALVVTGSLLVSGVAHADARDAATAREVFRAAQADLRGGQTDVACGKFAEAQRLDPNVGYLANLARCEEKRGHLADAREDWLKALDLARARGDDRVADVEASLAAIDRRVPRIVIVLSAPLPRDTILVRDGVALAPAAVGVALPVDPGLHILTASAPGYMRWSREVVIAEGAAPVRVEVPPLVSTSVASAPVEPGVVAPTRRGGAQRVLGAGLAGLGVVAAGAGTYFAIDAVRTNARSEPYCAGDVCRSPGTELRDDALDAGNRATVSAIAAGVLIAAGAALYFTAPRAPSSSRATRFPALFTF